MEACRARCKFCSSSSISQSCKCGRRSQERQLCWTAEITGSFRLCLTSCSLGGAEPEACASCVCAGTDTSSSRSIGSCAECNAALGGAGAAGAGWFCRGVEAPPSRKNITDRSMSQLCASRTCRAESASAPVTEQNVLICAL